MNRIAFTDYEAAHEINNAFDRRLQRERVLIVLLGPSGVGKSSLIGGLIEKCHLPLSYVKPIVTRPNRPGETDKISVDDDTFDAIEADGGLVSVNNLYGVRYGTPLSEIVTPLEQGRVPIMDFPLARIDLLKRPEFDTLNFYVFPDTIGNWVARSAAAGRADNGRLEAGLDELRTLEQSGFEHPDVDIRLVNPESGVEGAVKSVIQTLATVVRS